MTRHKPVPLDTADEIHELRATGLGRNKIGQMTGISAATVRNVLDGKAVEFTDELSTRQVSTMLNNAFKPHGR